MRKAKAKNDSFWQAGTLPFVALWAGTYAAAWLTVLALYEPITEMLGLSDRKATFVGVIGVTLIPAILQVILVERLLRHRMRGWIPVAMIASLITGFTFVGTSQYDTRFLISVMSLFVPIALLQTVWLWKRVQSAWLWTLTGIVASLVFTIPMRNNDSSNTIVVMSGLLYGIVQGVIMRYLWMQPKTADKAKIEATEDEVIALERIQRLRNADSDSTDYVEPDYQAAQRQTR